MTKWYLSKTFWVNFLAALAMFIQNQYGYAIPAEYQAYALVLVNLFLRTITKTELSV